MALDSINIGIPIDLQKLLKTKMLFQAGSGGGKSYGLRKIIESVGTQVQQIVIDPEGEFATLREKFDFLLVGKEGDIPLNIRYAETLAHMLLETGISAIIDLYELRPDDRILFMKKFGQAMVDAPKNLWHALMLYIDEAHLFCPEDKKAESTQAVIDLCTRGRKRGYCTVLATQRLPVLNKNATAQCYNKIIGLNTQDIDRKRAGEELGMVTKADFLSLRDLEPGEFYAFGPAISKEIVKFIVGPVITSHLESGMQLESKPPTPKAIAKILSKFSDIPEEAEKELATKQQFQAEISRLKTELSKSARQTGTAKIDDQAVAKSVNIAREDMRKHYAQVIKERDGMILSAQGQIKKLQTILNKIAQLSGGESTQTLQAIPLPVEIKFPGAERGGPEKRVVKAVGEKVNLPVGEAKILTACAQFPNGLRRDQFTVLIGYKRSSRDAYIQRLKEKGLVEQRDNKIFPTDPGLETLGPDFEPLPTGEELQQYWLANLPEGERKILQILIDAYPQAVQRDTLSEKTGYMRSSRDAYLQRMTAKEIVLSEGRGQVKASENLFS